MSRSKRLLITGCFIMAAGFILYGAAFLMGGRVVAVSIDRDGFHIFTPQDYKGEPLTYVEKELSLDGFSDIAVEMSFCDIKIEPSDHYGLSYRVADTYELYYEVKDGKLTLTQESKQPSSAGLVINKSGFFFSLFHGSGFGTNIWRQSPETAANSLTVYYPESAVLGRLNLRGDSGALSVSGIQADALEARVNFGTVVLNGLDVSDCTLRFDSTGLTFSDSLVSSLKLTDHFGEADINDVTVSDKADINMDSGDLTLQRAAFDKFVCSSRFGGVIIKDSNIKELKLDKDSGSFHLHNSEFLSFSADTKFCDIDVNSSKSLASYRMDLDTEFGGILMNGVKLSSPYRAEPSGSVSGGAVSIQGDSGDISITYPE